MRKFGKTDANQAEIVRALRKLGASVQSLASVGEGCPDLLVGYRGVNFVLEIKDGNLPPSKRKLTADESIWHGNWRGEVRLVESVTEAIDLVTLGGFV